jgi:hypothetical protein
VPAQRLPAAVQVVVVALVPLALIGDGGDLALVVVTAQAATHTQELLPGLCAPAFFQQIDHFLNFI